MKRSIYLVVLLAFIFRMGLAVAASSLLPQVGYDSKTQQAGYLFFDAYRRDSQAWDLAQSSKPLIKAFDEKFASDQYGGLLWMSAFIYRYLSAGAHQPLLVVLLGALIGALGVPFVYLAFKRWDNPGSRTGFVNHQGYKGSALRAQQGRQRTFSECRKIFTVHTVFKRFPRQVQKGFLFSLCQIFDHGTILFLAWDGQLLFWSQDVRMPSNELFAGNS